MNKSKAAAINNRNVYIYINLCNPDVTTEHFLIPDEMKLLQYII